MRRFMTHAGTVFGVASLLMALSRTAEAAVQSEWGADYTGLYSNNIGLTRDGRQSDYVNIFRGVGAIRQKSESLVSSLNAQFENRIFTSDIYSPQFLAGFDGNATWSVIPERLHLVASDVYTQAPGDPFSAPSITNRQNTNALQVGPDLFFPFSPVNRFDLSGRYENYRYQVAGTSNQRVRGVARFTHLVSPLTHVALTYEPSSVKYNDTTVNPDYRRQDAYATLGTRVLDNGVSLDLGRTRIDFGGGGHTSGDLARFAFVRHINSRSDLDLTASKQISDAGRDRFLTNPGFDVPIPIPTNPTEFVNGGLYTGKAADAVYTYRRTYGINRIAAFWRRLNYFGIPFDQDIWGGSADIGIDYSALWSNSVFGYYAHTRYLNVVRTDKDAGAGVRAVYRYNPRVYFTVESRYSRRVSTLYSQNWNEWRTLFTIGYYTQPPAYLLDPALNAYNALYR